MTRNQHADQDKQAPLYSTHRHTTHEKNPLKHNGMCDGKWYVLYIDES